jgi:hypothetical protein
VAAPRSPICTPPPTPPGMGHAAPILLPRRRQIPHGKIQRPVSSAGMLVQTAAEADSGLLGDEQREGAEPHRQRPNPPFHGSCPHRVRLRFCERIRRRGWRRMDPPSHAREELDPFFRKEFLGGGRKYGDGRHLQPVLSSFLSPCFLCVGTAPTAYVKDSCAQAETMVTTSQPLVIASSISRQRQRLTA